MVEMVRRAVSKPRERVTDPPSQPKAGWLPPLVIVLAVLATFWVVCTAEFIGGDDQANLTENRYLNPPTVSSLAYLWAHPYAHEYIPLSYTVWWVLVRVAGLDVPDAHGVWLNPYVFHSANLLLHIATCLVVYHLLRLLTGRTWAACGGALLFAVHPLQVEPVAWATGLKDLLSGLLSLIALWQYVRFAQLDLWGRADNSSPTAPSGQRRRWHYGVATAALLAAMFAKPSATAVPVLALIADRLILHRPWRRIAAALVPWAMVSGAFIAVGMLAQPVEGAVNIPVWARPLIAGDSLAFYLEKLCVPLGLATRYPHSANIVLASWQLKVAWLAPVALLAVAWALRRRWPWLLAGALIFAAAPLPVLGLVPFHYQRLSTVADRYVYVAMLGPSLALAFALAAYQNVAPMLLRLTSATFVAGLIALLAALSARQARFWQNAQLLYQRVLEIDPSSEVAYAALARDALSNNRPLEAERLARRAFELAPGNADNETFLGQVLEAENRHAEAAAILVDAVGRHPDNVPAIMSLADELANSGHPDQAMVLCRRALALDPANATAHRDLAMLLVGEHQNQQAVAEAAEAVRLEPAKAINHLVYGKTLGLLGRQSEADQQFAAARALDPNSAAPPK